MAYSMGSVRQTTRPLRRVPSRFTVGGHPHSSMVVRTTVVAEVRAPLRMCPKQTGYRVVEALQSVVQEQYLRVAPTRTPAQHSERLGQGPPTEWDKVSAALRLLGTKIDRIQPMRARPLEFGLMTRGIVWREKKEIFARPSNHRRSSKNGCVKCVQLADESGRELWPFDLLSEIVPWQTCSARIHRTGARTRKSVVLPMPSRPNSACRCVPGP